MVGSGYCNGKNMCVECLSDTCTFFFGIYMYNHIYIYICRSYDNGLMLICLVPISPFLMAESSYVIPSLVQFGRLKPRKGLRDDGLWLEI